MFLEAFKGAAAEGAAVELKLRLLAGKIPALEDYAHQKMLQDIENEIAHHFGMSLSDDEKETLRLCRQLRNKILHSDFRAARVKLHELGMETLPGGVKKIGIPDPSLAAISQKVGDAMIEKGRTFRYVADTSSTDEGGVYGWFLEAGQAGDFQKATDAFRKAATIVDRLAQIEGATS